MQYVSHYRTLRVGVASEKAPLQSFDAKTGEFKGVTNDILQYLSKHAGFSFEVVKIPYQLDSQQTASDFNVDIIAGVSDDGGL